MAKDDEDEKPDAEPEGGSDEGERESDPAEAGEVAGADVSAPVDEPAVAGADTPAALRVGEGEAIAQPLGASRYVHAAFFGAGIGIAFLAGKVLAAAWNQIADWPAAARAVPLLVRFSEEERPTFTAIAGVAIAVVSVIQLYRKEHVRRWADEVAAELGKVTWPTREIVTNGTLVVVLACLIAGTYVTLLDRFWMFVTKLVYGA